MTTAEKRMFVLFDGRARSGDTDDAAVLDTADSEAGAKSCKGDWPKDSIWYEYRPSDSGKENEWTEVGPRYDIAC